MEKGELILKETSALVQKDFALDYIPESFSEKELLDFLEQFVQHLLDNNMERLFYALYRLDINEQKVHAALSPYAETPPHQALAKMIFDREKQKAITRIEYSDYSYEAEDELW